MSGGEVHHTAAFPPEMISSGLAAADALPQPIQSGGTDSFENQQEYKISHHGGDKAVDGCAKDKRLAPHQGIHRLFSHIFQVIDNDGRLEKEPPGLNVQKENERPDEGEQGSSDESGDEVSSKHPGKKRGKKPAKSKGRIETAGQSNAEPSGKFLRRSPQSEKTNRLKKEHIPDPASAP
jgi:hypothetical protein